METGSLVGFFYAVLAFGLVLIPAIIIHELGHLFAAKAVGINVLEFGIGFPPKMMKLFRWGETDFTLNWLPIGGFVRPLGEDMLGPIDENQEQEKAKNDDSVVYVTEREELLARGVPPEKLKSLNDAKPWERIVFMVAGAGANFVSAFMLLIIVALIGLVQVVGARVQVVARNDSSALALAGVGNGDAIEKVNGEFFQSTEEFISLWTEAPAAVELQMRGQESQEPYTVMVTPDEKSYQPEVMVLSLVVGSPAEAAGLQPRDVIISVNGQAFPTDMLASKYLTAKAEQLAGQPMALVVRRASTTVTISVVPRENPPAGQGRLGITIENLISFGDSFVLVAANPQTEIIPQTFDKALAYSTDRISMVFNQIVSLPGLLLQGKIDPELARPVSIVGISQIGGKFLQQSVDERRPGIILEFLALISIFLGFTNLLPLPPLDGGRILFVLIEIVRGKRVPIGIEIAVNNIGVILLLGLGILVIAMDLIRPIQLP